jgi:hypothetical protein
MGGDFVPISRYITDAEGTRWNVSFAGGTLTQRHVIFRAGGLQFIVPCSRLPETLTDSDILALLDGARNA